jgi:hypothetical protein
MGAGGGEGTQASPIPRIFKKKIGKWSEKYKN